MHTIQTNTSRSFAATLMMLVWLGAMANAFAQTIATIAGNGSRTTTNFGGQATATSTGVTEMKGIAVDTLGNVYFTDGWNAEIRKVDTSGVISVFAGAAQGLMRPWGLAIDAANNVYAADLNAHRIWRITPAGVATSVAGTGAATIMAMGGQANATNIGFPFAVAVDTVGNIYILQSGILKVTAATGIITNFRAGCGSDFAITTDAANNVYRVCNQFNEVERFPPTGGVPTRIAGLGSSTLAPDSGDGGLGTNASLNYPIGVAVDSVGNVYISTAARIRKMDAAGIITTLAGTTAGYSGDGGLAGQAQLNQGGQVAVDSAGNVYFLDLNNNRVRKITLTVPPAPTIANIEGMNGQLAVRVAIPVIDGGRPIISYSATCGAQTATSAVSPIIVSGLSNGTAVACTVRATNALGQGSVSASMSGTPFQPLIHTIAGTGTVGFSGDGGQGNLAQLAQATGVVADSIGNLYVADLLNNRIRKISPAGVISTIAGTGTAGFTGDGGQATAAQLFHPHAVALDAAGNIYIAGYGDHRIRKMSTTGVISTIAGTGTAGSAGDGGQATSAQINAPVSIALDPAGNIYISERGNNKVRRINTSGVITTYAGTGTATYSGDGGAAVSAAINYPGAIRFDSGYLYIADFGNHRVRRVNSAGIISTYAGTGVLGFTGDGGQATSAQFHAPYGLSFHPNGDLYVGTAGDYRIRKITPAGIVTTVAGNGTNVGGANGSAALSGGVTPNMDVLVDQQGNLYYASYVDNVVRKITLAPPAPPTNVVAATGLGSLSVSFTPAATNGGIATTGYTVTCGSQSNSGAASPIVVSGLAAGIAVTCTARASSIAGSGQASVPSASAAPFILQSITFTSIPSAVNRIFGGSDTIAASGGASGNPVVFNSVTTSVCTTGGTNGSTLSFVGAGSCTINATQAGNASHAAAPQANTTFSIAQATQTITLVSAPSPASRVFGGSGTFVATGGASGNPVVFTSTTPSVCTTGGPNGSLATFVGVGDCIVNMTQAGNANYAAAAVINTTITIIKADQTITFGALPLLMVATPNAVTASTTAVGPLVSFTSLTPAICTATGTNGATITASGLGVCTFAADQAGNANVNAAPQVTRTLGVYLPAVWTAAANLQNARIGHTATKLNDGRVLLTGGFNGTYMASAEIFDPVANTWTAVGNLATGRRTHTATLLNNGKVLIAGGSAGPFSTLGSAELFDPATNTFTSAGTGVQRNVHQAVMLSDGRVMVIGGDQSSTADIYDPTTNTWTAAANMPTQRQGFIVSRLANGNVLVAGGLTSTPSTSAIISATAIIYNPTTNVWSNAASASAAAARFGANGTMLQNGLVLMAGGSNGAATAWSESYDSVANLWSATGIMSAPRSNHAMALLVNGSALTVGGDVSGGTLNTSDLYNATSNAWSLTANLNTARNLHTATALNDGRVLAAAGANVGSTAINSAELYRPIRFDLLPLNGTLSNGAVAAAYSGATFSTNGGLAPYTYSISSGTPPAGLSLSSAGVLSGTPTQAGSFTFRVVAIDANGYSGIRQYSLSITAGSQAIIFTPAPTINLQVNAIAIVSATGGASSNPVQFSVLSGQCVSTGPNGSSISGIDQGTCVIAANQAGNAGYTAAPEVTQNIEVVTIPGVPVIGTATRDNGQVMVDFTPPTRNGNSPITGYIATCGMQSVSGSSSPIIVSPLTNGVSVTCTVRAVNAIGTGPASVASNAVTPATVPDAPAIVSVSAGNASVSVTFSASASNGGSNIIFYLVNCGLGSATISSVNPVTVFGLPNGVPVTCRVLALNAAGESAWSANSSSVTPVGPPDAPTGVVAAAGNGSISVAFSAPFDNGSAITGYTATCGTQSANGSVSPIVVTGVANGLSTSCTVIATNAMGNGAPSAPSNAVVGAGVWRAAGTMAAARAYHTVTQLTDGRLLVAGGTDSLGIYPAAAEIYSAAGNSWTATGSLITPRTEHTATRLSNGRVLVAGGRNALGVTLSSSEIFDPATGLWTVGPNMTFARVGHNAMLLANGKVLLAGGGYNDANLYDPTTNTMSAGGTDTSVRFEASAILMEDGRVLVAGGSQGASVLANASLYNPATNTWAATTSMGVARRAAGAVLLPNGSALFVAGATSTGSNTQTAQVHSYNPLGAWAPAANVPAPVTTGVTLSVTPSGSVLRVAGRDGIAAYMNTTVAYVASANEWVQSSSLITARNLHAAVVLPNGQVLVVGGASNLGIIASAEIRDADGATAPNAPTIGIATPANSSVSVTFTPPANNGGSGITGYTATCGAQSNVGAASPIVVTGLPNNVTVTCTVTATNTFGVGASSAASNSVMPIGVPEPPTIGVVTTLAGDVTVNFTAPSNDGGSPVTGYTATCGSQSNSGAGSPIVLSNLPAGVAVTCTVRASNSFGLGAASAASNSVTPIGVQTINFGSVPMLGLGGSATISATGGASGQPVIFSSTTPAVCTVSGVNGSMVNGVSIGTCTIHANQAGNASYSAAAQVSISFNIGLGTQTITFGPAPSIGNGQSATISAAGGGSGNPIVFASSTPGVCTIAGNTVTASYAGLCTITASQAGNASYQAAAQASQSFAVSGSWSATGAMLVPRAAHTLTRLNDGRVLAVGGVNSVTAALASVELYNPATGVWSAAASLPAGRYEHTATLLSDGSVLVAGGRDASISVNSVMRYTPATNTWSAAASMIEDRKNHTATLLVNGKVLVAAGFSDNAGLLDSTELYNPATNTWSTGPSLFQSIARQAHTATRLTNGNVLLVGGDMNDTAVCNATLYLTATNTIFNAPPLSANECRFAHTATLLADSRVLVTGGVNENAIDLNSALAYSMVNNNWQSQANMSASRKLHTADLLDSGKVLVAGGRDDVNNVTIGSSQLYDAVINSWSATASLITPRHSAKSVVLDDGRVLVAGGVVNALQISAAELYDDGTALPSAPSIGTATAGNASATVNFTVPIGQGVTSITATSSPGGLSALCNIPCSSIVVNGLANGTAYTFTVTATNINGTGFASTASNSVTPTLPLHSQTIIFGAAPTIVVGGTGTVTATGGASGNPVLFSSTTTAICTVSGTNGSTVTGVAVGTCTIAANQAGNASYSTAAEVTQSFTLTAPSSFTVTPSASANGTISPSAPQLVASGVTSIFTVTPNSGYTATVGGTCGGSLVGTTYTTAAVVANCTVIANFTLNVALVAVQSRKTHAAAGTFDLPINTTRLIGDSVDVEPRSIGMGHQIVFQFNQAVTSIGTVSAVDATSNPIGMASAVINASNNTEVIVTLTGIAEASRVAVTLNGVNGTLSSTVSLGFLVGDVNNNRNVGSTDISAIKARIGAVLDSSNFKYDVNANGSISSTDITATKARVGLGI